MTIQQQTPQYDGQTQKTTHTRSLHAVTHAAPGRGCSAVELHAVTHALAAEDVDGRVFQVGKQTCLSANFLKVTPGRAWVYVAEEDVGRGKNAWRSSAAAEDVDGRVFQLGKQMWAGLVDMVVTWCRRRCGWARPRG